MEYEIVSEKIDEILNRLKSGKISVDDTKNEICDFLKISKRSVLCGDDNLSINREYCRDECERIKQILIKKGFINAGLSDAANLWEQYSDSYCAGWIDGLDFYSDEEIFEIVKIYIY